MAQVRSLARESKRASCAAMAGSANSFPGVSPTRRGTPSGPIRYTAASSASSAPPEAKAGIVSGSPCARRCMPLPLVNQGGAAGEEPPSAPRRERSRIPKPGSTPCARDDRSSAGTATRFAAREPRDNPEQFRINPCSAAPAASGRSRWPPWRRHRPSGTWTEDGAHRRSPEATRRPYSGWMIWTRRVNGLQSGYTSALDAISPHRTGILESWRRKSEFSDRASWGGRSPRDF